MKKYPLLLESKRLRNLLLNGILVRDIATPLYSFDDCTCFETIRSQVEKLRFFGVRHEGRVTGYVIKDELTEGPLSGQARSLEKSIILPDSASIVSAVWSLQEHDIVFISSFGEISGFVTLDNLQKPPMRMWLFGMLTVMEMNITFAIKTIYPEQSWTDRVPTGRLEKARALLKERIRRGQHCSLLSCLQITDKAELIVKNAENRKTLGFSSRKAGYDYIKKIESLRNNLAHNQDIITYDWETILNLANNMDTLLNATKLRKLIDKNSS